MLVLKRVLQVFYMFVIFSFVIIIIIATNSELNPDLKILENLASNLMNFAILFFMLTIIYFVLFKNEKKEKG